jgi:hypothetical protein
VRGVGRAPSLYLVLVVNKSTYVRTILDISVVWMIVCIFYNNKVKNEWEDG